MQELIFEITHTDGTTETINGSRTETMHEFEHTTMASLYIDRPQINEVVLHEDRDEIAVTEDGTVTFRGVLRDIVRGGSEVELVCDSLERYALDAEHSAGGLQYQGVSDTNIIEDAIADSPNLEPGTIEEINPSATFVFSYATPAKRIRTAAEAVGAEPIYNPDGTVDYVEQTGRDRSQSVTGLVLEPAAQNISGEFSPERDAGEKRVTHLTVLGAGEGPSQISATVVPTSDPYDYEGDEKYAHVRRYDADHWHANENDRRAWDTRINKDISNESTLADHGVTLIEEFNAEYLDIKTTVEDYEVQLGDVWTLRHPEENVDRNLRAVDVTRIADRGGVRHEVTFSNRRLTRQPQEDQQQKDVDRYKLAFEGSAVTMNTGGGRQPVDSDLNYQFDVYYPAEVEYEHRVMLHANGLPYRAYSRGAASGGGEHSHTIEFEVAGHQHSVDVTDHIHAVPLDTTSASSMSDSANIDPFGFYAANIAESGTGSQTFDLPTVNGDGTMAIINIKGTMLAESLNVGEIVSTLGVVVESGGETVFRSFDEGDPITSAGRNGIGNTWNLVHTGENLNGDSLDVTLHWENATPDDAALHWDASAVLIGDHNHGVEDALTSEGNGGFAQTTSSGGGYLEEQTTTNDIGLHTHPADPGIVESFDGDVYYPQNCQVVVNGNEIGDTFGDGSTPFQMDIDLAGELVSGQWNTIEISSEALGNLQAHLDVDVYRQVLGNG